MKKLYGFMGKRVSPILFTLFGIVVISAGIYFYGQKFMFGLADLSGLSSTNGITSAPPAINTAAAQPRGNFFNSSETPVPLIFDPFPQDITFTARIIIEDPKVKIDGAGWDAGVTQALKGMRAVRVSVLETQSESLQPAVLQGRELYVLGEPAYIDSLKLVHGNIKIADLYACRQNGPSISGGQEGWNFFCAKNIATPQHLKNSFTAPYVSWRQIGDNVMGRLSAATATLIAADWDQASATLALDFNVQTHAFCPYPWLGIINDEYGDFIPERQGYSTSECLSGPNDRVKIDFEGVPPSRELTVVAFDRNGQQVIFFVIGLSDSSIWVQSEQTE